ncbi:MAG TPA: hypothetical protein VES38_06600 [Methylotenera sp.]|nr:hypothetical protein [Methylotenera sp.]
MTGIDNKAIFEKWYLTVNGKIPQMGYECEIMDCAYLAWEAARSELNAQILSLQLAIKQKDEALLSLYEEVIASGNGDAKNNNWPMAISKTKQALSLPTDSLMLEEVTVVGKLESITVSLIIDTPLPVGTKLYRIKESK